MGKIKGEYLIMIIPTHEEVAAYVQTRAIQIDPEAFIDFYQSKGWVVGRAKMKDWKAAVRTWEKRARPVATSTRHRSLIDDLTDTSWAN